MSMDFITVFNIIDKNHDNEISTFEFQRYCAEENIDTEMVDKWMRMFDTDHSGKISLTEYCDTLGLKPADIINARNVDIAYAAPPSFRRELPENVQVISASMKHDDQCDITEKTDELIRPDRNGEFNQRRCANDLKKFLDDQYGRIWHVVICTGSYWMNYSHEPDCSIMFKIGRHIFLVWRTPGV